MSAVVYRARHKGRSPVGPGAQPGVERLEDRTLLSPLTWRTGVSLPDPRAGAAAVLAANDSVLVIGGGTTAVDQMYAGGTAWRSASPLDGSRSFAGIAPLTGGQFVLFGGSSGSGAGVLDSTGIYDPTNPDLTQDTDATLSTPRADFGYVSDGTFAYAIGGLNGSGAPLSSVERYNLSAASWSTVAPLPQALSGLSAVADGAGHVYTFGGATARGAVNAVYRYTIATNKWDSLAPMPVANHDAAAVLSANGKVYVMGGISGSGTIATVQTYALAAQTWSTETDLPAAVNSEAAVVDSLGRIEVIGGYDASHNPVANVTVSQQLDQPDAVPAFTSFPMNPSVIVGGTFTYQAAASGNPQPLFSLISGPAGMTISPDTGLLSLSATAADAGPQPVDIRAANFAGQTDQKFTLNVTIPAPTALTATAASATSISLSWTAPAGIAVDHYQVYERHFIHDPKGSGGSYFYVAVAGSVPGPSFTVTGLHPYTAHTYVVKAVTASGAVSGYSNAAAAQTYLMGDVNHDGTVNFQDLVILAQNYGKTGGFAQGDLNGDGKIDFADLVLLAQVYPHAV